MSFLFASLDNEALSNWCLLLTIWHSERPKLYINFGLSECNRIKEKNFLLPV